MLASISGAAKLSVINAVDVEKPAQKCTMRTIRSLWKFSGFAGPATWSTTKHAHWKLPAHSGKGQITMPSVSKKQHRLMEIAAHTPGGYGGVPQKVGKDFTSADKSAGKFQGKVKHMAKHGKRGAGYGMMDGSVGMSPRKAMGHGMGEGAGNFGVGEFASSAVRHGGQHPDAVAGTGAKPTLEDHERGIGEPIHHTKGHYPAQAAPHHGPTHPGGYMHGHHNRQH